MPLGTVPTGRVFGIIQRVNTLCIIYLQLDALWIPGSVLAAFLGYAGARER